MRYKSDPPVRRGARAPWRLDRALGRAGAVERLDAEGRAPRVRRLVEGRRLAVDAPGEGEHPFGLAEEAGEEDGGAVARHARAGRDVDEVPAVGEEERTDRGAGVDRVGAAAELAEAGVVATTTATADAGDREAGGAAAGEGCLAGALCDHPPGPGQHAVVVLEEAGEEL